MTNLTFLYLSKIKYLNLTKCDQTFKILRTKYNNQTISINNVIATKIERLS